jgi:hypothetical protein
MIACLLDPVGIPLFIAGSRRWSFAFLLPNLVAAPSPAHSLLPISPDCMACSGDAASHRHKCGSLPAALIYRINYDSGDI